MPYPEPASPEWQVWSQPVRLFACAPRGKNFQHLATAARGTRAARSEWTKQVGGALRRTLRHLLGPSAPVQALLESALFEAATAWPLRQADEPISIWVQRIAVQIAVPQMGAARLERDSAAGERPGGVREVLGAVYGVLRKLRPDEQVAFALLDLAGRSPSEVSAIVCVPPVVVRQRAERARRSLAFAARGDRLLARYMCIAGRLRSRAPLRAGASRGVRVRRGRRRATGGRAGGAVVRLNGASAVRRRSSSPLAHLDSASGRRPSRARCRSVQ